eukprot:403376512
MDNTDHSNIVFHFIDQPSLSPLFKERLQNMQNFYKFQVKFIQYKWPQVLFKDLQNKRQIYAYMVLFLDLMIPDEEIDRLIIMDVDQIVKRDISELAFDIDLNGKPIAMVPHCNSQSSFDQSPFWLETLIKQGKQYYFSGIILLDLPLFRQKGFGNILRKNYQFLEFEQQQAENLQLLDQDLLNYSQLTVPIHALDSKWLWCEAWCEKGQQNQAYIIDLCGDPHVHIGEGKIQKYKRLEPEAFQRYLNIVKELI